MHCAAPLFILYSYRSYKVLKVTKDDGDGEKAYHS